MWSPPKCAVCLALRLIPAGRRNGLCFWKVIRLRRIVARIESLSRLVFPAESAPFLRFSAGKPLNIAIGHGLPVHSVELVGFSLRPQSHKLLALPAEQAPPEIRGVGVHVSQPPAESQADHARYSRDDRPSDAEVFGAHKSFSVNANARHTFRHVLPPSFRFSRVTSNNNRCTRTLWARSTRAMNEPTVSLFLRVLIAETLSSWLRLSRR